MNTIKNRRIRCFNPLDQQAITLAAVAVGMAIGSNQALAQRALGVDVSNYQGSGINWSSVKSSGISFAWSKATEGTTFIDSDFAGNMNNGKTAGVYMGAYHFARPDLNTPSAEAAYFWNVAGPYIKSDGLTFMPMLDMETFNGVKGATSYSDWANQWCQDVVADADAAGVNIKPVIYMSGCATTYFNSVIAGWYPDIANYNGESPQTGSPWNSTGCTPNELWGSGVWTVWQYSSSGSVPGISGGSDVDVFNGTVPQLASTMVASSSTVPLMHGDYDGDGKPDAVLFHPSTGSWSVRFSSDGSVHSFQFGQNGDIPLLGSGYGGDTQPDSVVFRPSDNTWYIRYSTDGSDHFYSFGRPTDTPLMNGDFDHDGLSDSVIYRPGASSTWYIRMTSDSSVHSFAFGVNGDIPLLGGDFDGDGVPDAVLFRPSNGEWFTRFSNGGSVHTHYFGQSGDIPFVTGDFDGDGQPDTAIFRPSTGYWYVRFSSDASVHSFQYGQNGDVPIMNTDDFDGDGHPDAVIYRPSNNTWYVRFSSDGSSHSFSF